MAKPKKGKRFRYSLETVLKVRNIREKQEQDKFRDAIKELEEEQRKEREIKNFQAQKYTELRTAMVGGIEHKQTDLQNVLVRKVHLEIVKEKVAQQEKARIEAEKKKEEQRLRVIKAVKEKRIIEKNKEHKHIEWRHMMDKEDGKFLDEIATIKFARQRIMN